MKFKGRTFGYVALSFAAMMSATSFAQKSKKTNEKEIINVTFEHVKAEDVTELNHRCRWKRNYFTYGIESGSVPQRSDRRHGNSNECLW